MVPHVHIHRVARLVALAGALLLAACAGPSPHVKVLGAEQANARRPGTHVLTVFVEVVNPTGRDIDLTRLEYDLRAVDLFAGKGNVALSRRIGANSTAIVEIPVPVGRVSASRMRGVPYQLRGRLYAHGDHVERFWSVAVKGELEPTPVAGDHVLRVKLGPSR